MLFDHPEAARFVCRKLYRFFVFHYIDAQTEQNVIEPLAQIFRNNNYDILPVLDVLFKSEHFFDTLNRGVVIKSPIDMAVGLFRHFGVKLPGSADLLDNFVISFYLNYGMSAMLQIPGDPPNVAGWPGGRNWIDSTSLMLRLRLPHIVAAQDALELNPKDDDDQIMGQMRSGRLQKRLAAGVNWQPLTDIFSAIAETEMLDKTARYLWQTPVANLPQQVLQNHTDQSSKEQFIKTAAIQLMATPEYQLC